MGKVVTSEGLTEFAQSGKFTKVENHNKANGTGGAPKLETVPNTPTLDVKPIVPDIKVTAPEVKAPEAEDALTDEEKALPEKAQKEIQRKNRAVNEKHKAMMQAKEDAADAETLAQTQYNERRLAEQRADAAEAKLRELEAKNAPKEPELKEPTRAEFTDANGQIDWDKYTDAKADYRAKLAVNAERERLANEAAEVAKQVRIKEIVANANVFRKEHPDFDERMNALKDTGADMVPRFVLDFIEESKHSAAIAYHLATNAEVREKISGMTPRMGTAELGVIQAALVKPPSEAANVPAAKSVTPVRLNGGAPAPITPLDGEGTAGINTDPAKMSYKELRAYHKAKEAEKRRH